MNITIVGHGFVGKAVEYGFDTKDVEITIIDPKYNTNIKDNMDSDQDFIFICVPTPMNEDGSVDSSILLKTTREAVFYSKVKSVVIVKSTVTPDKAYEFNHLHSVVYNPEFLTERNAIEDFINPIFQILGGAGIDNIVKVDNLYKNFSRCRPCETFYMSAEEASFVKYGVNTYLASKVLWFNQFKDVIDSKSTGNFNKVINAIGSDPRVGFSHTQAPGYDNKRGFGGSCFPKDSKAFAKFANNEFTVLNEVILANNAYRRDYSMDSREIEQKVNFKE